MQRIGVRELRHHASHYLERVKAGETVEVTERGQLIALLVPPDPARSARERLVAEGRLLPGSGRLVLPEPAEADLTSEEMLDGLRAER